MGIYLGIFRKLGRLRDWRRQIEQAVQMVTSNSRRNKVANWFFLAGIFPSQFTPASSFAARAWG